MKDIVKQDNQNKIKTIGKKKDMTKESTLRPGLESASSGETAKSQHLVLIG